MAEERINTLNEFLICAGQNLPNHSHSLAGRQNFLASGLQKAIQIRTRQEAYRLAAYLITMAEIHLPDEDPAHEFGEILTAIQNI